MSWEEKSKTVEYKGTGYTWSQTIDTVTILFDIPKGTGGKNIDYELKIDHIRVGIKGSSPMLEGPLCSGVKVKESYWSIEDGNKLTVELTKTKSHDSWTCVVKGKDEIDTFTKESMDKRMLLERFQAENPGFDFSGAEFSGNMPEDPANFLKFNK